MDGFAWRVWLLPTTIEQCCSASSRQPVPSFFNLCPSSRQPVLVVWRQEGDREGGVHKELDDVWARRLHGLGGRQGVFGCRRLQHWLCVCREKETAGPVSKQGNAQASRLSWYRTRGTIWWECAEWRGSTAQMPPGCCKNACLMGSTAAGWRRAACCEPAEHARQTRNHPGRQQQRSHVNHLLGGREPGVDHTLIQVGAIVARGGGLLQMPGLGGCRAAQEGGQVAAGWRSGGSGTPPPPLAASATARAGVTARFTLQLASHARCGRTLAAGRSPGVPNSPAAAARRSKQSWGAENRIMRVVESFRTEIGAPGASHARSAVSGRGNTRHPLMLDCRPRRTARLPQPIHGRSASAAAVRW